MLVSYDPRELDDRGAASVGQSQGRQAARLAHRILTGTAVQSLPIELPERVEFVINLKTAEKLGLQLSSSTLLRADRVLQ